MVHHHAACLSHGIDRPDITVAKGSGCSDTSPWFAGARIGLLGFAALLLLPFATVANESDATAKDTSGTPPDRIVRIEVLPSKLVLQGPKCYSHLLVTGWGSTGHAIDVSSRARFESSDSNIVRIRDRTVLPESDGTAEVVVRVGECETRIPVTVSDQGSSQPVSFRYETLPVLTKQGCNSGGCHGSPSGKGGFRLSLFAFDPSLDEKTLIYEEAGRRTNRFDPVASLVLRKPLMQVPHGGGRRLHRDDAAYQVLHDWIAEGSRTDAPDVASCRRIEILPSNRVLYFPHATQQLMVRGHFSDGSVRDITDIATFFSSDETVADVDPQGFVTGSAQGEAAVVVRYVEHVAAVRLTFIQSRDDQEFDWDNPAIHNEIDRHVFAKLEQMQILLSPLCTDGEFVRRVYLDVVGRLPSPSEAQSFVSDSEPDKRRRLIDHLLEQPDYARFWATRWGDLLRIKNETLDVRGVHKFHRWLIRAIESNMPYDQFVRTLLTSEGSTYENPPANFFRAASSTDDCTETTSQTFMGIRIQCAKCHNHPYERWTQDNYYGIGAFFHRIQRNDTLADGALAIWVARDGEIEQPRTGQAMKPWLPYQGEITIDGESDRRQDFVDWLTRPDNPFLAKVETNRIWSYLFGRGIVDPIDDFRDSNPPTNPDLLQALAHDFVEHQFDRKHVIRTILNSRTYQTSGRSVAGNESDDKYFSHYYARRLSAELLLDAICQVADVPEAFSELPAQFRATQLPSPHSSSEFLRMFGKPARNTACECERSSSSDLVQALEIINGQLIDGKLRHKENRFRQLLGQGSSDQEIVDELYWSAFSRAPTSDESALASALLTQVENREEAYEDIVWALLNHKEFLFHH